MSADALPDRTVLIVDDSPEDAEQVTRLLRRAPSVSYRVRQVEYGRDVLGAIAELRPDCILLDHHLPDCTGLDVLDALSRAHGTIPVPVIMLTGSHVLIGTAVSAMQRGAMDYIAKENVTATLLYRAIENAIARFTDAKLLEAQRQELERRNRALDAAADRTARLLALATQLGAATTPPEVARAALAELVSATGAMGGAVLAIDEGGGGLDVLDATGLSPEHVRLWRRGPLTRDAADAAMLRGGEPLWLERRADIEARYPTLAAVAAAGSRSAVEALALLPLVMNSRVAGELLVAWQVPRTLPAEERAFLLTASRLVGQAVERARLLHTTQRALRDAEKARAEAESANALKSKFLATMSHELRTPLNAISGYVDLLELGVRGPLTEPQRDDLARVRRAQQHLLALINDVLDFARIESGRVDFRMAGMSVTEELATVHALIAPQAAARALELLVDVPAPPAEIPRVVADADRVRQILLNLMSNAVKFTPPGGTVTVRVRRDGDMALVQVEDTGIGIERDQLEAIFEPFVQVDGTLTRTREGTGLGLAISRELARGMGGDLSVRSRPGEGSTFTLAMPVERA